MIRDRGKKALPFHYSSIEDLSIMMQIKLISQCVDYIPEFIFIEALNNLKARQMERALQYSLDEKERKIIEEKYLSPARVNDISIYLDLGLTNDQYYIKKREANFQLQRHSGSIECCFCFMTEPI